MEFIHCPKERKFKPYLSKDHWHFQVNVANCKYCSKKQKCESYLKYQEKPQLTIHNRDGSDTIVEPIKPGGEQRLEG